MLGAFPSFLARMKENSFIDMRARSVGEGVMLGPHGHDLARP